MSVSGPVKRGSCLKTGMYMYIPSTYWYKCSMYVYVLSKNKGHSYAPGNAPGKLPQLNSPVFPVRPSTYQAHTGMNTIRNGMYSVQILGIAMPRAMPRATSHGQIHPVFPECPSTYQVHLQQILYIHGIAQCCIISTYHAIIQCRLVLTCHGT
jgi:hypothetical protein